MSLAMSTISCLRRSGDVLVSAGRCFSPLPSLNAKHGSRFSEAVRRLSTSSSFWRGCLTEGNINPCVREMEYAVRGKVPIEAAILKKGLRDNPQAYPFRSILEANIGDSHAMGQKPLTFVRQLLAACLDPDLLEKNLFPADVQQRAHQILDSVSGKSLGSYTHSKGIELVRKHIEAFIEKRDDGIPADRESIYLINGATEGIRMWLSVCLPEGPEKLGVMIPIPQYPLYTACIAELGAEPVKYYLDEGERYHHKWSVSIDELERAIQETSSSGMEAKVVPRVLAVINPGNPTGQHLSEDSMREIVHFCKKYNLLLIADEVYQENVWREKVRFSSFKKVLRSMGSEYDDVQLVSFNSISKGFFGECGVRGGYMEMVGFEPDVMQHVYKLCSSKLCANSVGQVVTDVMVNPPQPGDPSFSLFEEEKQAILQSLKARAQLVYERFNAVKGVTCNELEGALYAFPKVEIPEGAWADCRAEDPNMDLDTYYCLEFLRQEGVCVVPGNGFGQKEGTYHFRSTILPLKQDLEDLLTRFERFHLKFCEKYKT